MFNNIQDLEDRFLDIIKEHNNPIWAIDTLEYEFYNCNDNIFYEGIKYLQSLRKLY